MKYTGSDSDILCGTGPMDTLLLSSCWGDSGGDAGGDDSYLLDTHSHKLDMDSPTDDDSSTKATMDALDSLLLSCSPPGSSSSNLAELKPLPPFTGYTGHLSINGIPGHHYHTIAAAPQSPQSPHPVPSMVETNNNNSHATNQNTTNNIVYKTSNNNGATLYYTVSTSGAEPPPIVSSSTMDGSGIKSEYVDYSQLEISNFEDIETYIRCTMADTTVQNPGSDVLGTDDPCASRESWMDLAWIDSACTTGDNNDKPLSISTELQEFVNSSEFVVSSSPEPSAASSTLQSLLTQNHAQNFQQPLQQIIKSENSNTSNYSQQSHMPLLQSRLQNGPPNLSNGGMKPESSYMSECTSPSSTSYLNTGAEIILAHTTTGSPPGHVVSTTDNSLLMNGRYGAVQRNGRSGYGQLRTLKPSGIPSPDLLINGNSLDSLVSGSGMMHGNFPHTTTGTPPNPAKSKNRNRSNRNKQHQQQSVVYSSEGMLGKEKPVHRCTICNRGFLNKSNIKVHLRTHTGEKPFRCEVCGKAFRQKAHLLKHQQIHKRVGRD